MNKERHREAGLNGSHYRPLRPADIGKISHAALEILEHSGMTVYSETAFRTLRRAGAKGDEGTRIVKFPRSMVEDAIASNPSSVTLYSRDGKHDAALEGSRVHYGTGGTAIYVLDGETGERRPSGLRDVVMCARLAQALENIHVFTISVFPNEIENVDEIDTNRFFHALDNTTKHVMGGTYSLEGCRRVIRMAQMIAGGVEALRQRPFVSFITMIISPFKIDKVYGEITCEIAREGLPVVVPTEPLCGTTAPITLAGSVLVHVAETLAGITLVQAVRKGAPGICGSVGSISDLRTMGHLSRAIERGIINAAVAQMAQHFELPMYSTAGASDAKAVDVQAGYESAMTSLLVALSGANYIHDAAGLVEFDMTVSFEKMVTDNEILGMCQRALRGIEVTDETLGLEMILGKGPGRDYIGEEHTRRHMRQEFFQPKLANREPREGEGWEEDAASRARAMVAQMQRSVREPKLNSEMRRQVMEAFHEIVWRPVEPSRTSKPETHSSRKKLK